MSIEKTIIVIGELQAAQVCALVTANWREMAASGHPLAVKIYEYKAKATDEQRSLLWIRYEEIADQAWIGGRQYADETWHIYCKQKFLPDEVGPSKSCCADYRKWAYLPDGSREMIGSTEKLTVFGKAEYLSAVMAYGSTELGVQFGPTPSEMRQYG